MAISNKYIPVVIEANYAGDFCIDVVFSNSVEKRIDCKKYIGGGIFESLKDENYFRRFFVDGWTISWPNGADIAPETLYYYS
jgi:hypothetical protein